MIAMILARLGLSRDLAVAGVFAMLLALGGLGCWRATVAAERMLDKARASGAAERDAIWKAEIAASNLEAERQRAVQRSAAEAAEARAAAEIAALRTNLSELEKQNAALPDGDRCGVDRDRIRLLNRP